MKMRGESIIFHSRYCQRKERAFFWVRQLTDRSHTSKHRQHTKHRQHRRPVITDTEVMSDVKVMVVRQKEQFNLAQAKNYSWYFLLKQGLKGNLEKILQSCIKHLILLNFLLDQVINAKKMMSWSCNSGRSLQEGNSTVIRVCSMWQDR